MSTIITVATLFVIGSLFGWVLELFFRRFVSQKKWMNPGFLTGPYLPIYGFGVVVLYIISNIYLNIQNQFWDIVIRIIAIGIMMTLIEFIAGLIFIKGMGLKLWDYSNNFGNIMGIICPAFSLIWLVVGSLYYFLLNPTLVYAIDFINNNLAYSFFVGGVIGMIVVDTAYSIHLGIKIKQFKDQQGKRFEDLKQALKQKTKELLRIKK